MADTIEGLRNDLDNVCAGYRSLKGKLELSESQVNALRAQLATAQASERERCAKAICLLCHDGVELVPHNERHYGGWHQITELGRAADGGTDYEECAAFAIRALSPNPNQEKPE